MQFAMSHHPTALTYRIYVSMSIYNTTLSTENKEEFTPTWLYIKQHNVTGLKYFGKTTRKDPIKYKGSGKYWIRHINKHGNDVTTLWCQLFTDRTQLIDYALNFSRENNITESIEWANLINENGVDGITPGTVFGPQTKIHRDKIAASQLGKKRTIETKKNMSNARKGQPARNKGISHTVETKEKMSIAAKNRPSISSETKKKMSLAHRGNKNSLGHKHSDDTKKKMSDSQKGRITSFETKQKLSLCKKGKSQKIVTCPYCQKQGGVSNLTRYHFNNCKYQITSVN